MEPGAFHSAVMFMHNLSSQAQREVIDLRDLPVSHLELVIGKGVSFRRLSERQYLVELKRYGYGWFRAGRR